MDAKGKTALSSNSKLIRRQARTGLRSPHCSGSIAGSVYSTRWLSIAAATAAAITSATTVTPTAAAVAPAAIAAAVDRIAGAIGRRMVVAREPAKNASLAITADVRPRAIARRSAPDATLFRSSHQEVTSNRHAADRNDKDRHLACHG